MKLFDDLRMVGFGLVAGLTVASAGVAQAGAAVPAQAPASSQLQGGSDQGGSALSRALFAPVSPSPALSPEMRAEIRNALDTPPPNMRLLNESSWSKPADVAAKKSQQPSS